MDERSLEYRKDIQVLRGVSVLLVVLYHLNISAFGSGFLGVDVFFVISGFLMAILYDSNDVVGFFQQRARRLFPAYLVTIILTLVVAFLFTLKLEFDQVVRQTLFGVFFLSNIDFWSLNSYFSKVEFKPLLHLWSLAVEIQFYLILPILVWIFSKVKGSIFVIFLLSIIGCFAMLLLSPKTAFFMMPFRVWEFILGYIVAIYFTENGRLKYQRAGWLGGLAFALILSIPIIEVQGEELSILHGHPGGFALVVSVAAAVFLATGMPQFFMRSIVSNALEIMGKYSYSLYLVHFPIIVLYLYEPFLGTSLAADPVKDMGPLVLLIIGCALMLFHLVEDRARRGNSIIKKTLGGAILAVSLSFLLGHVQIYKYSEQEMKIFDAWNDRDGYRCSLLSRVLDPLAKSCLITESSSEPQRSILLVGNSHADSIKKTFAKVAEKKNIAVYFIIPNDPLLPSGMSVENVLNIASAKEVDAIVLHFSAGLLNTNVIQKFARGAEKKNISVSFIMPVPVWERHVPKTLLQEGSFIKQTLDSYQKKHAKLLQTLDNVSVKGFSVYQVADILCNKLCKNVDDIGRPLYFDKYHLTLTGSKWLEVMFEQLLEELVSKS